MILIAAWKLHLRFAVAFLAGQQLAQVIAYEGRFGTAAFEGFWRSSQRLVVHSLRGP